MTEPVVLSPSDVDWLREQIRQAFDSNLSSDARCWAALGLAGYLAELLGGRG